LRILEVRDLHFSYDGLKPVLCGVNLVLERGEALALMGASGGGKTTLLKIVAGLLYPYEGVVKLSSDRVGYIPQHFGLVKNLTALQNVLLGFNSRCCNWSLNLHRLRHPNTAPANAEARHRHTANLGCRRGSAEVKAP
jgi:ABC-type nitrate/sulfonate/bicarbonate transport system ATPase subunit